MYLRSVRMERYRPFAKRQDVELRPLTIVIGKNNAGKSALVRLPLLLQKSLSGTAQAPLDLDVEGVDLGRSFVDLVHGRVSSLTRPLRVGATFGVEGAADELLLDADILHSDERRIQLVHTYRARYAGAHYVCRYAGPETPPAFGPSPYEVEKSTSDGGTELSSPALRFDGLWPVVVAPDGTEGPLIGDDHLAQRLRAAIRDVRYLGPFRDIPKREYAVPSGSPRKVGIHGRDAPAVLGADSLRFNRQLVHHVSAFYREHLGSWDLDAIVNGDSFQVVVSPAGGESYKVNWVDAGAGLSQALPIIVQRILDEEFPASHPWLEIVEQPELHLHPAAHGALADLYIKAIERPGTTVLVETHSENFVLRAQRRVAEGTLDPAKVAIYFVDTDGAASSVRRINILPTGEVDFWPEGVFAEDFEEVREMRRAQDRRGLSG